MPARVALPMHESVLEKLRKPVVYNICVLGAMVGLARLVKTESLLQVLEKRVPADLLDLNRKALDLGLELAKGT